MTDINPSENHETLTTWHDPYCIAGQATFHDGVQEGKMLAWYASGRKKLEATYKNGERHGLDRLWHENGKLMRKIKFKDGKKHGLERVWHDDGALYSKTRYKDGLVQAKPIHWLEWTERP